MIFYLKYRPQKINELDLERVRESLTKILSKKDIPHAFLFSGPKGTGKTSAARILAKYVNCMSKNKPCNKCEQCISITKGANIDVLEVDAASNRGIDDVRSLRDAVKLSPASAQKKVYIIDEAHMLTTEASNALLKTLEEPPAHAIFILATTNPEKLIPTIRSRTTNIVFKKATESEIVRSLKRVAKGENIKVDDYTLTIIASSADGSFRDAVKVLEELSTHSKSLSKKAVEEFLYSKDSFDVKELLKELKEKDTLAAVTSVNKAVESGVDVGRIIDFTIKSLRLSLMGNIGVGGLDTTEFDTEECVDLIDLFSDARSKLVNICIEQVPLEIAIVRWCESDVWKDKGKGEVAELESKNSENVDEEVKEKKTNESTRKGNGSHKSTETNGKSKLISDEVWSKILKEVKERNASTLALLRASKPIEYKGENMKLGVYYKFHKEHLESSSHRDLVEEIVGRAVGSPIRLTCILTEPPKKVVEEVSGALAEPNGNGSSHQNGAGGHVNGVSNSIDPDSALTSPASADIINVAKEIFES